MEVEAFVETGECRKKFILHYFGEELKEPCGKCDNCLKPKEKREAKQDIILTIQAIKEVNELATINYIINLLMGKKTKEITGFGHDKLSTFGKGAENDELYWNSVIRKALIESYIRKDIEQFGLLKINPEGLEFIKNPKETFVRINHVFTGTDSDDDDISTGNNQKSNAMDPVLMDMLQNLRKSYAKKVNLPPYVIFQDPSLEDMATQYPITMEELAKISGVSQGKALRYGKEFLQLIEKYVEENEIERPSDFVMRSVANKSAQKIFIIQNIDKKIPLEEIARSKNMTMEEVLVEIESIINSGTKVNLNYYLNEIMDEEIQGIISDYFMESETDSLEAAFKELEDEDIEMKEIRLMRIKFLSDMAN